MASITTSQTEDSEARAGLIAGLASYLLWGFLPLLFKLLDGVENIVVVADRTLCGMVMAGIVIVMSRRTSEIRAALADWRSLRSLIVAGLLLGTNWFIYIYAVGTGQVLEATFGYFINPMVNIAIGMVLLGERLNRWQAVSVAIALVAIGIQAIGLAGIPFIALSLAVTFAAYGYIRKTVNVTAAPGLFVETLALAPIAIGVLAYTFIRDGNIGPHADPATLWLLLLTGPATAAPLLLFAYAVRRLRLTTIGMLQYIAPSIAFILAITVFGEHLNGTRLFSFALIWLSLIVYTVDSVVRRQIARAAVAASEAN